MTPEWLLRHVDCRNMGVRIYGFMWSHYANRVDHTCRLSRKRLAAEMSCSLRTIDRTFRDLVHVGALKIEHQHGAQGRLIESRYTLLFEDPSTLRAAAVRLGVVEADDLDATGDAPVVTAPVPPPPSVTDGSRGSDTGGATRDPEYVRTRDHTHTADAAALLAHYATGWQTRYQAPADVSTRDRQKAEALVAAQPLAALVTAVDRFLTWDGFYAARLHPFALFVENVGRAMATPIERPARHEAALSPRQRARVTCLPADPDRYAAILAERQTRQDAAQRWLDERTTQAQEALAGVPEEIRRRLAAQADESLGRYRLTMHPDHYASAVRRHVVHAVVQASQGRTVAEGLTHLATCSGSW